MLSHPKTHLITSGSATAAHTFGGVAVSGVPVGEEEYIQRTVSAKVDAAGAANPTPRKNTLKEGSTLAAERSRV